MWHALDPSERGTFTVHPRVLLHARKLGIETSRSRGTGSLCVVASYADERRVKRRPIVLLEHGAGQNYSFGAAGHPSYSGGARHDVVLFLCPNETVAARWRACYPDSRVEVIGAEPKMDRYYRSLFGKETAPGRGELVDPFRSPPVVAFAFHWPGHNVVPEAGNAWPTFGPHLGALTEHFTVLGHGHPRVIKDLRPHYERMGIEVVEDADEVFERADLLAVDNSSVLFEWASLDRPVVLLNSPLYRRDVEHGLRFWTFADIGPQVDDPVDLVAACHLAMGDPLTFTKARRRMADAVFPTRDGLAAVRAADAIRTLLESPDLPTRRTRMPRTDPYAPRTRGTARRAGQAPQVDPAVLEGLVGEVEPTRLFGMIDGTIRGADATLAEPVQTLTGVDEFEARSDEEAVRYLEDREWPTHPPCA